MTQADSQALKRAKVAQPSSALVTSSTSSIHRENLLNRLQVPDIEYESDSETASTGRGSGCDVGPDNLEPRNLENRDTESVSTGRSNTPILQDDEESTDIQKKVILASHYCYDRICHMSTAPCSIYCSSLIPRPHSRCLRTIGYH